MQPYVNPAFSGLFVQGRVLADDSSHEDLIPEATLRWQPNDELTFFVAYKQGFKSGGFDNGSIDSTLNADPIADITYEPEHVEGVEGGVKAILAGGNVNLELDVYHYKYSDLQLNFFNATTFAYRTINAGGAVTSGVELQGTWVPEGVEGLTLMAAIAYNDAHYTQFTAPCYAGQSPAQGCPVQPAALKDQDLSGVTRNLAPKWAGNIGFDYTVPVGNGLELGFSGNVKYKSKYLLSAFIPRCGPEGVRPVRRGYPHRRRGRHVATRAHRQEPHQQVRAGGIHDNPSTGGNTGTANAFQADRYGTPLNPRTIEFELTLRY